MSPLAPLVLLNGALRGWGREGVITLPPTERFQPGDTPVVGENVGVIPNVHRDTHQGNLIITSAMNGTPTNPTVIPNLDVTGQVIRQNNVQNVHVKNVRVLMGANPYIGTTTPYCGFQLWGTGCSNFVMEDIEVAPTVLDVGNYGIYAWDATVKRFYVHDCTDLININRFNAKFYGGVLKDSRWWANDPRQSNGAHNDLVQVFGGNGHVLQDILFDCGIGPAASRVNGGTGGNFGVMAENGNPNNGQWLLTGLLLERLTFQGNPYSHIQMGDAGQGAITGLVVKDSSFTDSRNANIRLSPETVAATQFLGLTRADGTPLPANEIEGAVSQR